LKELLEVGRKKGTITNKEIINILDDVDLDVEQIEKIMRPWRDRGLRSYRILTTPISRTILSLKRGSPARY
jgi:hypothetical protein